MTILASTSRFVCQSWPLRRIIQGVAISAIAVTLGSCGTASRSIDAAAPQAQATPVTMDELTIVTTFLPITQFTKAVVGDRATVTQLLPTNTGPHDYQAKPDDAQTFAKADVLVQNGLDMELFLDDLIQNAANAQLKIIDSSQGVAAIATEVVDGGDPGSDHAHDADEKKAEVGHDHGLFNPHIWLDPKRVVKQVENIRDGLIAADPDGKSAYTANAAGFIQKLQELDAEATQKLKPFAGKTFVAFHDFAPYFAQSYNLKANFLVDVPDENPSPDDVKRVMETVQQTNLKTLLTEPQSQPEIFSTLANDLNVKISSFDPMETGGSEALQPDYYLKTMRQNINTLLQAFTGQSPQSTRPVWGVCAVATLP